MIQLIHKIADLLDEKNIQWALGGSLLLKHYKLVDVCHDIDIMVSMDHVDILDSVLSSLGSKEVRQEHSIYKTVYFYEYLIDGIEVDVMAGMTINHDQGQYVYPFDQESIQYLVDPWSKELPYTCMEDWFVIYQVIPNRQAKVDLIEGYLSSHPLKRPDLLQRQLKLRLPTGVKERVSDLLKS